MKTKKIFLVMTFLILLNFSTPVMANDDVRVEVEARNGVFVTPGTTRKFEEIKEWIKKIQEEAREDRKDLREETREERKNLRENIKEDRKEAISTIAVERKTVWTEMKRKQVQMITQRIEDELNIRYKIILKLKEKISERITKKSTTHDMTLASAKLAQFSDAQYKADMVILNTKLGDIAKSETPKVMLPEVRGLANKVRISIRSMHQFLMEVMKLIASAPAK
ncbi:MAG: hypothetical protein WC841_05940 [Candidatus Shapirobacteria bacterium]|jgi:Skp family chaperone for outer membrane proteins